MNVAKNLQYLRKRDKITQEELADKLGVSRQSVSKWETGEAYPETEKLLALCDLFEVSLDGLMRGDLTEESESALEEKDAEKGVSKDEYVSHMNVFSRAMGFGVLLVLFGVAACIAVSGYSQSLTQSLNNAIAVIGGVVVVVFSAVAVFLFIYYGMKHDRFRKEHPTVGKVFDENECKAFSKRFATAIACLVSGIILDVAALIVLQMLVEEGILAIGPLEKDVVGCYVVAGFFVVLSFLIYGLVYFGIQHAKYSVEEYNEQAQRGGKDSRESKLTSAICGVVMLTATAFFLVFGFVWNWWHPAWVVFPVAGILCGIISTIMNAKGPHE